ncbi:MAG: UDP-N-acetylmuramoyl-L-alanine--D-glutamate ligase [Phycisphaerae bacterium]
MSTRQAAPGGGDLAGRRVTVMGLGRFGGGVGVTRWLCGQGAKVTVSDAAAPESLAESAAKLDGCDVTLRLGRHDESDVRDADLLVVNPAVPKDAELIVLAEKAGVPRTSEINLFLQRCPAPVVGITGSVGKSTTTAMAGLVLQQRYRTHVGGNIGGSLLMELPDIAECDVVVLELSSFQLEDTPIVGISPPVALVTNLTPNHLDRHGSMDAYAAAKKNIFRFQSDEDLVVLNRHCPVTSEWAADAPGRVKWFDREQEPFELAVPGGHNQANAQAAWAIGQEFGVSREETADALREFAGLPHRLQWVAEKDGVRYFNDSKCTTPNGAVVALEAFEPGSAVIILGGYDKGVSFGEMGRVAAERARAVVTIGQTGEAIASAVENAGGGPVTRADSLPQAVSAAADLARPGGAVLLSPACASYDMFTNYQDRGEQFVQLVRGR